MVKEPQRLSASARDNGCLKFESSAFRLLPRTFRLPSFLALLNFDRTAKRI